MSFRKFNRFCINMRKKHDPQIKKGQILNDQKRSLQEASFLFTPMDRKQRAGKASVHASLRSWRRAGLTVEASFVLPLFFLAVLTLVGFMDIYQIQTEKLAGLCELAKTASTYAYVQGEENKDITLPSIYSYKAPFSPIPLPTLVIYNKVKVRAWTGSTWDNDSEGDGEQDSAEMVYVTENGSVYHGESCSYLNLSVEAAAGAAVAAMRNQYGGKYYPCEHCSQGQQPSGTVYVTKTGDRYHNQPSCSGLKRTIRLVKLEEVQGDLAPCSRCGGH